MKKIPAGKEWKNLGALRMKKSCGIKMLAGFKQCRNQNYLTLKKT